MKRKICTIMLALVLCCGSFALAACNGDGDNNANSIKLKVWASQQDQVMVNEMADSFKALYPEEKFVFTFGVVGEPDARAKVTEDIAVAADVFMFADDQLRDLVNADALYEVVNTPAYAFKDVISERNTEASVGFATYNDKLYAMPATADNTFFMYYDKRYVKEADLVNLDKVLEACTKANKDMIMDLSDGWYISSFFISAGCEIGINAAGKQTCDYNNDAGIKAAKAADALATHPKHRTGDNPIITGSTGIGGTGAEAAAVAITGSWNASAIKQLLGDNFGVCALPQIKIGDDYVPWKNFGGAKLVGIKKTTKSPIWALRFADFISNEENQIKRFETRGFGPSNINAAQSDKVKADAVVSAIASQMTNSVPQGLVLSNFWTPTESLGAAMEDAKHTAPFTEAQLKKLLDDMVAQIIV